MWRETIAQNGFLMTNEQHLSNSDKSGNRKTFVATVVANVVTERIWLDTTDLEPLKFQKHYNFR